MAAFVLPAHTPLRSQRLTQSASRRRRTPLSVMAAESGSRTSQRLSRRALLLCAPAAAALFYPLSGAGAYSSPYKPGQKSESKLPNRLYEDEISRVVTTSSGLQYFDLLKGDGAEANFGDTVFVYYTSRLRGLNGIKITSSFDDPSAPPLILKVGASDVVPGVSEALTGMKVGGKRRAVLPPKIAYKSADMKPAVTEFFARRRLLSVLDTNRDATIVFDLELVKVK